LRQALRSARGPAAGALADDDVGSLAEGTQNNE
jgi:hypothetical protein